MNLGELAEALVASAKVFRNEQLVTDIVPKYQDERMTDDVVSKVLGLYMETAGRDLPDDVNSIMQIKLRDFIPHAVEVVRHNSHMNDADDVDTLTQNNADAVLVAFVNQACSPLDLALYTRDLVEN